LLSWLSPGDAFGFGRNTPASVSVHRNCRSCPGLRSICLAGARPGPTCLRLPATCREHAANRSSLS
jgi:hypothetical protein